MEEQNFRIPLTSGFNNGLNGSNFGNNDNAVVIRMLGGLTTSINTITEKMEKLEEKV
jgi:hypothetical protein